MKKQFIYILIFGISLAVMALVFIQLYWINNAIKLKEEEFHRKVNESLQNVVEKLEKKETLEKLKSHQKGRFLFLDTAPMMESKEDFQDSGFSYMMMKDIQRTGDDIEISTIESDGKTNQKQTIKRKTSDNELISDKSLLDTRIKIDITKEDKQIRTKSQEPQKLDSILRQRIGHKTAFVGDIVKSLMEVNLYESITDRITRQDIDSLLTTAFKSEGIFTPFNFGVFGSGITFLIEADSNETVELKNTPFRAKLFPNDIIEEQNFLHVTFPNQFSYLISSMQLTLWLSLLVIMIITGIFFYSVLTIVRQKKLSEIKNDFINNMTHELKTPISTIAIAHEALNDPEMNRNESTVKRYIGIIGEENARLGTLVQNVLQSAVLDKGDFSLNKELIDSHQLIDSAVEVIGLQVKEKKGTVLKELNAERFTIEADKIHLTNVLYNLLDNANKYAKTNPEITIGTYNKGNSLFVYVKDNGIGINQKNQAKIFDKLYRVPTGNIHDVKGFGLGLSYVKIITEKHNGIVSVESKPDVGSTFTLEFPLT